MNNHAIARGPSGCPGIEGELTGKTNWRGLLLVPAIVFFTAKVLWEIYVQDKTR